ncbi:MAG: NUDIX hydrolase [Anaerolineae bacterium]|nr:NUDIX hydrolase [Anaerolineae bacterium]
MSDPKSSDPKSTAKPAVTPIKPWTTIASEELLARRPWLSVSVEHVRLPNGHEIPDYYKIEMPEWAQVFVLTADGHVAMIEHYKHGPEVISLELPAGYLDPGEDPETSARRELREETGLAASDWRYLGRYFMDGNRGCGASHIFLAQNAQQVDTPHLEASEIIAQHRLTLDEVRAAWLGGRITNLSTIAAVGLALAALAQDEANPST